MFRLKSVLSLQMLVTLVAYARNPVTGSIRSGRLVKVVEKGY